MQACAFRPAGAEDAPDARLIAHSFAFDPTHGHNAGALRLVAAPDTEPAGFEDFWRGLHARMAAEALCLEVRGDFPAVRGFRLRQVGCNIGCDFRASAWLVTPEDEGRIRAGIIASHGYDGRTGVEARFFRPGFAVILPVAPGFHISSDPRLPLNDAGRHVVHGIESPDTYVLGLCAAAVWRAPEVAEEVLGRRLDRWHYFGWSFGGGIGALALPWTPRVQSAELGQPTFGHHPIRLQQPSVGSSNAVRQRYLDDPSILRTLAFFDAATASRRLRIPVVFACALFDPAVTPPSQFAVANAHPGPKRTSVFLTGHYEWPGEDLVAEMRVHHGNIAGLIGEEFIIP